MPSTVVMAGGNNPPSEPNTEQPSNQSTNRPVNTNISWNCSDPDGDPLTYNVYFGNTTPPPQVWNNQTNTTYCYGILEYNTTYHWYIVAWDNQSASTQGPFWRFNTTQEPGNGTICGYVNNSENGSFLENATVTVNKTSEGTSFFSSVKTNVSGFYIFNNNVSAGTYDVEAYKDGFLSMSINNNTLYGNDIGWVNISLNIEEGGGGDMPLTLNRWESSVTPAYIVNNTESKFNLTLISECGDSGDLLNLTVILPKNFAYVANTNGTTINPPASYNFSNTSSKRLVWNATDPNNGFSFSGTENFWFNATSNASLGSETFQITAYTTQNTTNSINMTVFTTTTFNYNGTIKNNNGQNLPGAFASISVQSFGMDGPPVTIGSFNDTTDENGTFNITGIPITEENLSNLSGGFGPGGCEEGSLFYQLSAGEYNDSSHNYAINISATLPSIPISELWFGLRSPEIYLKPAISFRVRANGSICNYSTWPPTLSYGDKTFQVMVKDRALGFPVKEFTTQAYERIFSVAKGRNYSLSIFSQQSFPISIRFNDIYSTCENSNGNFNITGVTTTCTEYNGTYLVDVCVNTSSNNKPLTGYFNSTTNLTAMRVVAYTMEDQDMVFEDWALPYNLDNETMDGNDDVYNLSARTYNVTLPATQAPSYLMLRAYARNASGYYMGSHIVTAEGGDLSEDSYNFTMYPLINGTSRSVSANNVSDRWNDTTIVNTKAALFNLVNSTGALLNAESPFIEVKRELEGTEYMQMISGSNGRFNISLLQGSSIKKLTIYSKSYAPVSTPVSASILAGSANTTTISRVATGTYNITMRSFGDFDPLNQSADFMMMMYKSNDTCNVPNPPQGCSMCDPGDDQNGTGKDDFSPLKAILKGDISMLIGCGNISVYYINVDLLASGPPDASFTTAGDESEGGLASAWKFGSQGPEIYDEVLIGVPYSSNLSNKTIKVTIPLLYDNEYNIIWNSSEDTIDDILNETRDGLAEYKDYVDGTLDPRYAAYLNGTGVICNESNRNLSSGLGYRDTENQTIWIKIPHFSGIGPEVTGVPDPPSNFTASAASTSSISLSWTRGTDADYTLIHRNTGTYPTTRTTGTNVSWSTGISATDSGLSSGTTYYYSAWGYNATSSEWSTSYATAYATTTSSSGTPTTPTTPTTEDTTTTTEAANTTKEEVENLYNLSLEQNFSANDTDGDGTLELDDFEDPNDILNAERLVNISGNSTYLISVNGSKEDIFIWDTAADAVIQVTHNVGTVTETTKDVENDTITITVSVNKSDWIYIEVTDEYSTLSDLTVKASDGRVISSDMMWRENGKIYVLDDPDTEYNFTYNYTIFPPTFDPVSGTTFDTAKPTLTTVYNETVTIVSATLNDEEIILTSTDNATFIYVPESNLTNGAYTLNITVQDDENNTRTDEATFTINVEAPTEPLTTPTEELPTTIILVIVVVVIIIVIIAILFKTGYIYVEEKPGKPKKKKPKK